MNEVRDGPVPTERLGENPVGRLDIHISLPEIEARLVNASVLADYEVWGLLFTLFTTAACGFLIAYLQSDPHSTALLVMTIVLSMAMLVAFLMAINKRMQLSKSGQEYTIRGGDLIRKSDR
jgi:hypothetical protein